MPATFTAPLPVQQAARAVIDGIESRSPKVAATDWVTPMLAVRGLATAVMDRTMLPNTRLAAAIARAESNHTRVI